jgi:hypothetical protein
MRECYKHPLLYAMKCQPLFGKRARTMDLVFDVKYYSIQERPSIRTTVSLEDYSLTVLGATIPRVRTWIVSSFGH